MLMGCAQNFAPRLMQQSPCVVHEADAVAGRHFGMANDPSMDRPGEQEQDQDAADFTPSSSFLDSGIRSVSERRVERSSRGLILQQQGWPFLSCSHILPFFGSAEYPGYPKENPALAL